MHLVLAVCVKRASEKILGRIRSLSSLARTASATSDVV